MRLADRASERERGYIRAVGRLYDDFEHKDQRTRVVDYERAMNELATQQPEDTEAAIFYALSLAASALPTDKTFANQLKAGSILEPLWEKQPNHPGLAHYIIHTYDYPPLAEKARAAARRYSSIAPSAAHALHMPSHTFTRVGMWDQSVDANNRSRKVAESTGSIAEALHAADYAMYAHLQMGRKAEAKAILDALPALAARFDPTAVTGAAPGSAGVFALAAIPARWTLERGAWAEAAALEPKASAFLYPEAMTYFARALGAARTRNPAKAKVAIDSLASIQQRLTAKGEPYWAEQVAIQHLARASVARSRRASGERCADAHARSCDARGCHGEERGNPGATGAGARAAGRHVDGAEAAGRGERRVSRDAAERAEPPPLCPSRRRWLEIR